MRSCWAGWKYRLHVLVSYRKSIAQLSFARTLKLTRRRPDFDSPSVFCRLLDKNKGGYFCISPPDEFACTTKQQYLPSSCILQTRYIHEDGVVDVVDFFPRPKSAKVMTKGYKQNAYREAINVQEELKKWVVRRVECIRGSLPISTLYYHKRLIHLGDLE